MHKVVVGFLVVRVFFMDEIIGLFNLKNDSLEFVNMIKNIFYYDCLTIPALAINCAVLGILYGYGQTFLATINNVIRIVTRISVLWYLQSFHPEIGAEAAVISMGISNVLIDCSDLVFLDIVMPKKDGNMAIDEIIAFDKDATIIIVSSVGTQAQLKSALEAGATDFIQKPINKIQIIDAINKYLGR